MHSVDATFSRLAPAPSCKKNTVVLEEVVWPNTTRRKKGHAKTIVLQSTPDHLALFGFSIPERILDVASITLYIKLVRLCGPQQIQTIHKYTKYKYCNTKAWNASHSDVLFLKIHFEHILEKFKTWTCIFVCLVCFGLYIDVLSVSMRLRIVFCIYEHILKYTFGLFRVVLKFSN